ncbi:MFS transporter [Actinokineospora globicatena]|uniref:MFS transporter n=1 Tax=Actinokineospora globicatena TaxID=103729 RepID=UPI0020A47141|nr:MFS transporter [Actinokineospora globicatena]MCP2306660.1 putative arabinose efflux permease, MFS family [Actinokineospora globicatena]GLW82224.1 MFS transporter [Actinokineospora globicatena]GLW89017.1 MFS transporter [Actinokineospora globicatena]
MRRLPLVALLAAVGLSACGSVMTMLAVPWFVLATTGSAAKTGLTAGAEVVGTVVAALLAGPMVDRFGRRAVSVASDLVAAAVVATIPLLHATVGLPFGALIALAVALGMASAPGTTARKSMMPGLIALTGVGGERAASGYDGVARGAWMLGSPLAGVLIAVLGPQSVLLVDAATFLASAALVRLFVPLVGGDAEPESGGYLTRLRRGMAYVRGDRLMLWIVVMVSVTNLLDAAFYSVLMPVFAQDVLHSSIALGVMSGVFSSAALAGSLTFAVVGPRLPRRLTFALAFLLSGAPRFVVLALGAPLPVVLALFAVLGLGVGAINPLLGVTQYERVPESVLPMVVGVMYAGAYCGMPLGAALAGLSVEALGLTPTLWTAATLYLAITLAPLLAPTWREMDNRKTLVHA